MSNNEKNLSFEEKLNNTIIVEDVITKKNDESLGQVKMISFGAALMSAAYQYSIMRSKKELYSKPITFAMCSGAGLICYFMTYQILKSINKI